MTTELTPGAGSPGSSGSDPGTSSSAPAAPTPPSGWRESLSEDIRGEKSFDVFKGNDWNEVGPVMAKSFLAAEKMTGNAIKIPGKDAKPEEINAFFKKLGRPDKPEEYQYTKPTFVSKDIQWDGEMEKAFIGVAHKIGLNPQQVQELVNWQGNLMEGRATSARQQINATLGELKKEWGTDYERRLILGERAVREVGGDGLVDLLERTGLGNNTILVKAFAQIGEILSEDGMIDGRIEGAMGADDIKSKLEGMLMDKTHPINDLSHPGHKVAVEEYTKLTEKYARAKK